MTDVDGDLGQGLRCRPEFVHVAHGRQRIVADERASIRHVELQCAALSSVAGVAEELGAKRASHA